MVEEGGKYIDFEKDGETLSIEYSYDVDGYVEDDYYNGTGAFVKTSVDFSIDSVECYNEDGEDTESNFDEDTLYRMVA